MFLFVQRLDLLHILHDDVQANVVAAAGSQNFRVALRLRDIGPFVLKHPHGNRQPPVVFQIRAAVKLLKALGIEHTNKVVHAAVVDGDDAEDGALALAEAAEVHFVH